MGEGAYYGILALFYKMATPVPKKKGNTWTVVVDLPCAAGERKQKRFTGKTKCEVEAKRDELIAQIRSRTYVKPSKQTLAKYLLAWVENHDIAEKTCESYAEIIRNHLIPKLGKSTLAELEPVQIKDYADEAQKTGNLNGKGGLSKRTVQYHVTVLRTAMNEAVGLNIIKYNPCQGVKVKSQNRNSSDEHKVYILSPDELNQLQVRVSKTILALPTLIAASTGLRLGEVLGLRWKDVNFNTRMVSIRQAVKKVNGKVIIGDLKTDGSARTIDVDKHLISVLKSYKARQAKERLARNGKYEDYDIICAYPNGMFRNPGTVSSRFRRVVETINLPISFHDLRHTHATMLYEAGLDIKKIQERLGHYDVAFTLRTYCQNRSKGYYASDMFEGIMNAANGAASTELCQGVPDDDSISATNL